MQQQQSQQGTQNRQLPAQQGQAQQQRSLLPASSNTQQLSGGFLQLQTREDIEWFANRLIGSRFFDDVKDANQAVIKIMYGMEIGMTPMECIDSVYFGKGGKPGIWAKDIAAKIKRSGRYDYQFVVWTEEKCTLRPMLNGAPMTDEEGNALLISFTKQQAAQMNLLNKTPWLADLKMQLFYKAVTRMYKALMGDLYRLHVESREDLEDGDYIDIPAEQAMLAEPATQALAAVAGKSGRVRNTNKNSAPPAVSNGDVEDATIVGEGVRHTSTEGNGSEGAGPASQSDSAPSSTNQDPLNEPAGDAGIDALFNEFNDKGWTKNKLIQQIAKNENLKTVRISDITRGMVLRFRDWANGGSPA